MTMTARGHIHNGTIVLDEPVPYQEGAKVDVDIHINATMENWHPEVKKFLGIIPSEIDVREVYLKGMLEKYK